MEIILGLTAIITLSLSFRLREITIARDFLSGVGFVSLGWFIATLI